MQDMEQIFHFVSDVYQSVVYIIFLIIILNIKPFVARRWLVTTIAIWLMASIYTLLQSLRYLVGSELLFINLGNYYQMTYMMTEFSTQVLLMVFLTGLWAHYRLKVSPLDRLLFSWRGRVSRSVYWLLTAITLNGFIVIMRYMTDWRIPENNVAYEIFSGVFFMATAAIFTWINIVTSIKRFHDCNRSGWCAWGLLIPVIGPLFCLVYLGFFKGTEGKNKYGDDPILNEN